MTEKEIIIHRYRPGSGSCSKQSFNVPLQPGSTLLQAFMYIYEELDSTLAFRYGCRYKHCGLCGVTVDGRPRLACKVRLETVSEVAPLAGLPILRDLAVDRTRYFRSLAGLSLFPYGREYTPLGQLKEELLHRNLMSCLECLCCVASCPSYNYEESGFAGPYLFIKLAQLRLDPRDAADRTSQAGELGIERCKGCSKCNCPNGIDIKGALASLVSN